jgi:hypothetical protein
VPRTSPKQTRNTAKMVSIEMSIGREDVGDVCEVEADIDTVVMDWSAECSWAE